MVGFPDAPTSMQPREIGGGISGAGNVTIFAASLSSLYHFDFCRLKPDCLCRNGARIYPRGCGLLDNQLSTIAESDGTSRRLETAVWAVTPRPDPLGQNPNRSQVRQQQQQQQQGCFLL